MRTLETEATVAVAAAIAVFAASHERELRLLDFAAVAVLEFGRARDDGQGLRPVVSLAFLQ